MKPLKTIDFNNSKNVDIFDDINKMKERSADGVDIIDIDTVIEHLQSLKNDSKQTHLSIDSYCDDYGEDVPYYKMSSLVVITESSDAMITRARSRIDKLITKRDKLTNNIKNGKINNDYDANRKLTDIERALYNAVQEHKKMCEEQNVKA